MEEIARQIEEQIMVIRRELLKMRFLRDLGARDTLEKRKRVVTLERMELDLHYTLHMINDRRKNGKEKKRKTHKTVSLQGRD